MKLFKDATSLGVIVSRMQVPYLTESHINMIKTVQARHNKIAILLGVRSIAIDDKNPYPVDFRKQMINEHLRCSDIILPLQDHFEDKVWVERVDMLVESLLNKGESAIIYGGSDCFIPFYTNNKGQVQCIELLPEDNDSGTELRNIASKKIPTYSREVAEALLYYYNLIK